MEDAVEAVLIAVVGMTTVFMIFVAPVWIIFHYLGKRRETARTNSDEQASSEILTRAAERMEDRIATLEKILDAEVPRWRQTMKDHER